MLRTFGLLIFLVLFLPFVAVGGGPKPFSLDIQTALCVEGQLPVGEPFVEVAVYSTANPSIPLFRGFTNKTGSLALGLFADLPETFYIEVKRDQIDGILRRTLPLARSNAILVGPRETIYCMPMYYPDSGGSGLWGCSCRTWG